jgi:hypothetical protein
MKELVVQMPGNFYAATLDLEVLQNQFGPAGDRRELFWAAKPDLPSTLDGKGQLS